MKDLQFVLNGAAFNTIFPFYILIDENLVIKSFGKSISKILPEIKERKLFLNYFTIQRPYVENISPQNFRLLINQFVVLTSKGENPTTLRGQIEQYDDGYLFIGSPWLNSIEDVFKRKLTQSDFALHDPLLDMLHVLKNQEISNKELKHLLQTVDEQRKILKKDKEELNKLSLVASANKNGVVFTHPHGTIFWCNEAFMNLTGFSHNEIIGRTLMDVGRCKFSNKNEIHKMVKAFYEGKAFDVEYINEKKQGETFWAKTTGQTILDAEGNVIQYFAIIEDITNEKQREEQLLLLSSIAEKNSNGVVISDKDGKIEWVNPSFLEMTEYSIEELIGQKPGQLLQGEETDPKTINYLKAQIKNGLPFNCEILNYSKTKQKYWVRIQGQALHNKYGEVIKYFSTEEDITFEKEFNQQLIESENRLNSLVANLQTGILLEDENKKILLVNKKFCSLFRIDAEPEVMKGFDHEILFQGTKHLFKNPEQFLERITEIVKLKKAVLAEEIELADGSVLERSYIPIDNTNKYNGHLWSYEDITIKKKYKESLEAEREKYSGIIANMNMGLVEVDNDNLIKLVNQSFCDMSGFSTLELIGKSVFDIFSVQENNRELTAKRKSNLSNSYQIKVNTKSQEEKHWLISRAPNYNVNGEIVGSIGISLDITAQKKLELQKEQLLRRLGKQNDSLNEYAQVVSHDLKAPLRSIHSLVSWIKEDNEKEFNEQTKQYLDLIEDKVEKMDNLIQGILTYSKVDSTKVVNEEINLNEIIQNIIKIIYIPDNISVTIANELPTFRTDRFRMLQLFQNLISNAVNYCDKEQGFVEVASSETKTHYIFTIKDNGPGIDPKYQTKIFKIFQSFSQEEKATGIGLSIVKRIVDNYKGKIWIESEIGTGSTFFIKLPKHHGTA